MPEIKIAFLGFGNVGKSLAKLLLQKRTQLFERYGISFITTGIATGSHGSVVHSRGIDLDRAISILESQDSRMLGEIGSYPSIPDTTAFIRNCGANVIFENTPVNYATGQPAVDSIKQALDLGIHVVTANKGPVVHAYHELNDLARRKGVKFYFESAVMDGAPIFSLFRETLPAANLRSLRGVLNSTTNIILSRMEVGEEFDQAVEYCQRIGIAETDPSGDIDGWDAAVKVAALSTVIMDTPLKPIEVERQGIRGITRREVSKASEARKRWKLVCSATREEGHLLARVKPELVGQESPFYAVTGSTSIIQFETDVLGQLSIIEENPGPMTTAYGCMADFVNAVRL